MRVAQEFTLPVPAVVAWPVLRDPRRLAECLPGIELAESIGGEHRGRMRIGFGPTVATFEGVAEFEVDDEAHTGSIDATGVDTRGTTSARATIRYQVQDCEGGSAVRVDGVVEVAGPLATFAETGGTHVVRGLLEEMATCLSLRVGQSATHTTSPTVLPSSRLLWIAIKSWFRRIFSRVETSIGRRDRTPSGRDNLEGGDR